MRSKAIYRKIKPPTWSKMNSKECVPNEEHRKGNVELKKILEKNGYKIWDHCHILDEGYQITARKAVPELAHHRNPYLSFRWVWMDEFHQYWRASLTASYDYIQDNHYMHPWGFYEVWDITKTHVHHLPELEKRVIAALLAQTPLP